MKQLICAICILLFALGCNKNESGKQVPPVDSGGNPPPIDGNDDGSDEDVLEPEMPFSEFPIPALAGQIVFPVSYDTFLAADINLIDLQNYTVTISCGPVGHSQRLEFSPDGRKFLHVDQTDGSQTHVTDLAGNNLGKAPSYPKNNTFYGIYDHYSWSPDSNYLYYGVYYHGIYEIDTLKKSGRLIVRSRQTYDHNVAVSTDGKYLVWTHHEYGTYYWIFCMSRSGDPPAFGERRTVWSGRSEHDREFSLYFVDEKNLAMPQILAASAPEGRTGLLNVETLEVTYASLHPRNIVKSPDGNFLARIIYDSKPQTGIDIITTSDQKSTRLDNLLDAEGQIRNLAFSPDSQYLAVSRFRTSTGYNEVLLYSLDFQNKWFLAETATGAPAGLFWVK